MPWSTDPIGEVHRKNKYNVWFTHDDLNWVGPELREMGYLAGIPEGDRTRYRIHGDDMSVLILTFGYAISFEYEEILDSYND